MRSVHNLSYEWSVPSDGRGKSRATQHCPYCHSDRFIRYGLRRTIQRYRCKDCTRTFTAQTGKPLWGIWHKGARRKFDDLMSARAVPLRMDAAELGVSRSTIFRWRNQNLTIMARQARTASFDRKSEVTLCSH